MDDDLSQFQPSSITLTGAIEGDNSRSIAQSMVWDLASAAVFTDTDAYIHALFLNDSDTSQYGPGTFLDDTAFLGEPVYEPETTLPSPWYKQNRIGDLSLEKRFGVVTTSPDLIVPGVRYQILWATPTGDANLDNANLDLSVGTKLFASCHARWCVSEAARCRINQDEWGIDPIPGTHSWAKPYEGSCFNFRWWSFLPLITD